MDYKYKDCSFHVTHSLERKEIVIYPSDESRSPELSMTIEEAERFIREVHKNIVLLKNLDTPKEEPQEPSYWINGWGKKPE